VGPLRLDPAGRRATVDGRELSLRPKEFDLLATLAGNAGQALTRERLMAEVWDENWSGSTKTLDMHVLALRRKLADAGVPGEPISTLRGYGYRYETA
jgi:DNA-binding response OmpR family regulator